MGVHSCCWLRAVSCWLARLVRKSTQRRCSDVVLVVGLDGIFLVPMAENIALSVFPSVVFTRSVSNYDGFNVPMLKQSLGNSWEVGGIYTECVAALLATPWVEIREVILVQAIVVLLEALTGPR